MSPALPRPATCWVLTTCQNPSSPSLGPWSEKIQMFQACMILGKLLPCSESQFPYLKNEFEKGHSPGWDLSVFFGEEGLLFFEQSEISETRFHQETGTYTVLQLPSLLSQPELLISSWLMPWHTWVYTKASVAQESLDSMLPVQGGTGLISGWRTKFPHAAWCH